MNARVRQHPRRRIIRCAGTNSSRARIGDRHHLLPKTTVSLRDGLLTIVLIGDPENLVTYRNSGRVVVLEAGTVNGTLTCAGDFELAFGVECPTEDIRNWVLRKKGKAFTLGHLRGITMSIR